MTKDGSQQTLSTQGHAPEQRLLFFGHPYNGCQVKQVALCRYQRLTQFIYRT
jgi:hypothetical protein